MAEFTKHPLAVAWNEWLESEEGQRCRDRNSLGRTTNIYLENRLHYAFMAGVAAQEKIQATADDAIVRELNRKSA